MSVPAFILEPWYCMWMSHVAEEVVVAALRQCSRRSGVSWGSEGQQHTQEAKQICILGKARAYGGTAHIMVNLCQHKPRPSCTCGAATVLRHLCLTGPVVE